jgi:hypothetical protein
MAESTRRAAYIAQGMVFHAVEDIRPFAQFRFVFSSMSKLPTENCGKFPSRNHRRGPGQLQTTSRFFRNLGTGSCEEIGFCLQFENLSWRCLRYCCE